MKKNVPVDTPSLKRYKYWCSFHFKLSSWQAVQGWIRWSILPKMMCLSPLFSPKNYQDLYILWWNTGSNYVLKVIQPFELENLLIWKQVVSWRIRLCHLFKRLKMKFTPFSHEFHPFFLTPFLNESHPFFGWNSPLFKNEFHPFFTWISPLFYNIFYEWISPPLWNCIFFLSKIMQDV